MYDIITFGSATRDIFLRVKNLRICESKGTITGKEICLPYDSKINVEKLFIRSGGGGTNTAATFKNQGFDVAYCGMVGKDSAAEEIIRELKERGIDISLISQTERAQTNCSVVANASASARTTLAYRGASELLERSDLNFHKLKAKWFYFAPFPGKSLGLFTSLINFASNNGIKIALNPGTSQLSLPPRTLLDILKKVDILLLNQEEASFLTKIPHSNEEKIFKEIDLICPGIAVMTKGESGVTVSDGKYFYQAPALKTEIVDTTGAGDAFGAGFVSGFIKTNDVEYAIQLGIANSSHCLKKWGAKEGLLMANDSFRKVRVRKTPLTRK